MEPFTTNVQFSHELAETSIRDKSPSISHQVWRALCLPVTPKHSRTSFMRKDVGEAKTKELNLHQYNGPVFYFQLPSCQGEGILSMSCNIDTLQCALWLAGIFTQSKAQKIEQSCLLIGIRLDFMTEPPPPQLHCGCFGAKRIPEDPYKVVGTLLRNKPTSMEGFAEPTSR